MCIRMHVCMYVCAGMCVHAYTRAHACILYMHLHVRTCMPMFLSVYMVVHTYMRDNPYRSLAASFCRHGRINKPCVFPTRSLSTRALVPAS